MTGTLSIVATPIGNLKDITQRGLEVLRSADLVLAEDTRVSARLLGHYDIGCRVISYHQHSSEAKKLEILNYLLQGKNLALVTDAGTPGVSDPGNELIDFLLAASPNIKIVPIPGVSAITSALSVSGFNTSKFVFLGFLPKKKRNKLFTWLETGAITFAFYESPNRILKTLDFLSEQLGEKNRILVARELTKIYETLYRGTIKDVKEMLSKDKVKGEIVVVVEG